MARYDFPATERIDEIHFPTNRACVLRMRHEASFDDSGRAVRAAFEILPDQGDPEFLSIRMYCEILQLAVDWNLEDADGNPLPLTLENLRKLDPKDGDLLLGEAHRRIGGRPVEAEAPFANGLSKSSTGMRSSRRRS